MSKQTRHATRTVLHDMTEGTACIAGAFISTEFTDSLTTAAFANIEIHPTHRVHTHAQAAIILASH